MGGIMGTQGNKGFESIKSSSTFEQIEKFELLNQFLALCMLTIVLGVFLSGCGQPGSIQGAYEESQGSVKPTAQQSVADIPVVDKVKSIEVQEYNQADVLVVVDNSASMRFEQANMAERFSSLMDEMKGLDWKLSIVTTDVSQDAPKKDGRFLEFAGLTDTTSLTSDMDPEVVKKAFAATIQRPSREGSPNEQGIKATYRALERHPDWLRPNASFNVVVVTDSDETPAKGKAEIRNNPSDLLKYIQSNYPSKPFFFHSIIVKEGDEVCLKKDDNEAYGRSYAWLSEKTGGVIGDVCQKDYSQQLKMIGQKVSQQIREIQLDCLPVENSVKIQSGVDDIQDFTVDGLTIKLAQPLPAGMTQVHYQCYAQSF